MIIDTHSHVYLPQFSADADEMMQRAVQAGVGHIIMPVTDDESLRQAVDFHHRYPELTSVAVGYHPTDLPRDISGIAENVTHALDSLDVPIVAVGEIGIDLYWDTSRIADQRQAFAEQCRIAALRDLPVIIHCRDGLDDTLDVLSHLEQVPRGVLHSFTGTADDVERIRQVGDFYFGINGVVTFKNCAVKDALSAIGPDRLLLETDAPYLAPVPHRGKRNEPAYVALTMQFIASHLGIDPATIEHITTTNARCLFLAD